MGIFFCTGSPFLKWFCWPASYSVQSKQQGIVQSNKSVVVTPHACMRQWERKEQAIISWMLHLWVVLHSFSTKHGVCLCVWTCSSLEPLRRKVNAHLNKSPEEKQYLLFETLHRDHVWLHFKTLRGPQAPSIHYKGIAASHLSQSRAEHVGGCSACLARSSEANLWEHNRH